MRSVARATSVEGRRSRVSITVRLLRTAPTRKATPAAFFDAIEIFSEADFARLCAYAKGGCHEQPILGFWAESDLE